MTQQKNVDARTDTIATALIQSATTVKPTGHQRWTLELTNGSPHLAAVWLEGDWLLLDLPLPKMASPSDEQLWRMLALNADIAGAAKFALDAGGAGALRAEIPLADDCDGRVRIPSACESVKSALDALGASSGRGRGSKAVAAVGQADGEQASDESLADLCSQSGWVPEDGPSGSIAVKLDIRQRVYYAMLTARGDGGVDLQVHVASAEGLSDRCRSAMAAMLLRACGVIRMARASACSKKSRREAVAFEVCLPGRVTCAELGEALSSLSVACETCGNEIRALRNEEIAQAYLSLTRGRSPRPRARAS